MTVWQQIALFCSILGLWSGASLWALKWLLDENSRHVSTQLKAIADEIADYGKDHHKLELELERYKREAQAHFVGRDEWIQFGIGVEGKLDRVLRRLDDAGR